MQKKKLSMKRESKVFVVFLILAMIIGTSILSQTKMVKTYVAQRRLAASYAGVQAGEDATTSDYVKFDAFILNGGNQYRGVAKELNQTAELYMNINVLTNGRLEDGRISIESGRNFEIKDTIAADDILDYVGDGYYRLNTMQNGTFKSIPLVIEQNVNNISGWTSVKDNMSRNNAINFTGTHVAEDGTRTNISKTVNVQVDWYGSKNLDRMQSKERSCIEDETNQKFLVGFTTELWAQSPTDTFQQVPDKAAVLYGTMPTLNGYAPTAVKVTNASKNDKNITYNYNTSTRRLDIRAETVETNGITEKIVYDHRYKFNITIEYPYEAYRSLSASTNSMNVTIRGYLEGYNNPNLTYQNPATSGTASNTVNINLRNPKGDIILFSAETSLLEKANSRVMYDRGVNVETGYVTDWKVDLVENEGVEKIAFTNEYSTVKDKEYSAYQYDGDYFQNSSGNFYSMNELITYTGIRLDSNSKQVLGENGYIIIYNADTNEEIKRITMAEAGKYIAYDTPVKRVKIETSKPTGTGDVIVRNYKKINNEQLIKTYTKTQFTNFTKVYSGLNGFMQKEGGMLETVGGDIGVADYAEGNTMFYTEPQMSLNTQEVNQKLFRIDLKKMSYDEERDLVAWLNPTVFIEFPQEIEKVEIKEIDTNNNALQVKSYKVEQIGSKKIVKIYTEGLIKWEDSLWVDMNIIVNENTTSKTGTVRTYAYNQLCDQWRWLYNNTRKEADIYDINGNGSTSEQRYVNYTNITYATPTGLITRTTGSNFNSSGDSIIGPQIGKVQKTDAGRVATVGIDLFNNYNSNLSNMKIVGKVPFAGNTYQLNSGKLGSNFTASMTNAGITLPSAIRNYAKVYYSEKENTTQDLADSNNAWTTSPADWSKVRTYLIDFGNFKMSVGSKYNMSYQVQFPSNFQYGNVTYATHAVYFDINQTSGTISAQTETNKVGFSVVPDKTYSLQLNKLQKNSTKAVQNVQYKITGPGIVEGGRTYYTNSEGKIIINNLYPEETYTLEETYAPNGYIKNEEPIQLQTYIEGGALKARILQGTIKGNPVVENATGISPTIKLEVENQAKYTVSLTKYKQGTTQTIENVRYVIKGKGLPEAGRIVATNVEGKVDIANLYPGEQYTLQEISAPADYIVDTNPITFQVDDTAGVLSAQVISGTFKQTPTINQEERKVEVSLENKTGYKIEITKYKEGTTDTIEGVRFNVKETGSEVAGISYATDANGIATIGGLVPGRSYTLQEQATTQDYVLNQTPIQFTVTEENGVASFALEQGTPKDYSVEQATENSVATIKMSIENEPKYNVTFTKYKTGTTQTLKGVEFNLKGEGLPVAGKNYTTDENGQFIVNRLVPGASCTLQETRTLNQYVLNTEPVVFKVVRVDGNLQVQIESGEIRNSSVTQVAPGTMPEVAIELNNDAKYQLNIVKYKKNTSETVQGVTFQLNGEGIQAGGKSYTTDYNGNIQITDLVPGREYTLKETKTNTNYMLDTQTITLRTYKEGDILKAEVTSGTVKTLSVVQAENNTIPIVQLDIENEPKYNLQLTKYETGTTNTISNVKFNVKGKGMLETGTTYFTNNEGIANIQRLELNEIYTIKETYAKGYYVDETEFTVKVSRVNGELQVEYGGRAFKENPSVVLEANKLPVVQASLENVNIPKYNLELTKVGEKTGNLLQEAKFEIAGPGRDLVAEKEYVTIENGTLKIENLYVNEEYTLTETKAPTGYKLSETPVKFKAIQTNGVWSLQLTSGNFLEAATVEGNTIKVKWEDELLFKLEKRDDTTGELLPGAKFTIQDLNGNNAKDVAGNEVGQIENIDGTDMRVLTTDESGMLTAEIAPGLYKVTEVQAPFGYELPANPVQYFGIDESQEASEGMTKNWEDNSVVGGTYTNTYNAATVLNDGSIVAVGTKMLVEGVPSYTTSGTTNYSDGIISRYSADGKLLWTTVVDNGNVDSFNGVKSMADGGYIIVGNNYSEIKHTGIIGYGTTKSIITRYNKDNQVVSTDVINTAYGNIVFEEVEFNHFIFNDIVILRRKRLYNKCNVSK